MDSYLESACTLIPSDALKSVVHPKGYFATT